MPTSRPSRIGALQELFADVGASKEVPIPKPFRRNAPNVEVGASPNMLGK
jgi:hypothetical protein